MDEENGFDDFYKERDEIANPNVQTFFQGISRFNNFMDKVFSMPMDLTQKVLNLIQYITQASPTLCASCVCLTMTATLSVTSIAAGVGLGIGIGCLQPHTQNFITATTNTTTNTTTSAVSSATLTASTSFSTILPDGTINAASRTNLANAIATRQGLPAGSVTVSGGTLTTGSGRRKRRGLLDRSERQAVLKTLIFTFVYNLIICGAKCTSAIITTAVLTLTQIILTIGTVSDTIASLTLSITSTTQTATAAAASTTTATSTSTASSVTTGVIGG